MSKEDCIKYGSKLKRLFRDKLILYNASNFRKQSWSFKHFFTLNNIFDIFRPVGNKIMNNPVTDIEWSQSCYDYGVTMWNTIIKREGVKLKCCEYVTICCDGSIKNDIVIVEICDNMLWQDQWPQHKEIWSPAVANYKRCP